MSEGRRLRVLARADGDAAPLLAALGRLPGLEVAERSELRDLAGAQVVLAAGPRRPEAAEAEALAGHLRRGGGLLLLGPALEAWSGASEVGALTGLAGWSQGPPGPVAELRVRPVPGGPISDRLGEELLLRDRLPLGEPPPPQAAVLLTVPWQHADRAAGLLLPAGAGRCAWLGLGWTPAVFAEPAYQRLVHRGLRAVAGLAPPPPLGVGLYGYGAIGREHAAAIEATDGLDLRGVCDSSPQRRDAAAAFQVPAHAEARRLLADPSVDLVVVGVPPAAHAGAVLECLEAGKHVVCEKPFALRGEEVDRVLAAANAAGRLVTVYQSRRWDPDYRALEAAVRSGAIGELFYMESFIGGFGHPCGYWHSHEPVSGGTIYDWGAHYFDWTLQLFGGEVTAVSAAAHKRVWHDVTNADQVRVDLTFDGGRQATFLQSDVAAALKPKWYLLGTAGAATGEWRQETVTSRAWTGDLVEERLQPAEAPARVAVHRPDGQGGVHVEQLALPPRVRHGFYRNLADHLLLGEPLAVSAKEAGRNVRVMEAATRSAAADGRRLEVRI